MSLKSFTSSPATAELISIGHLWSTPLGGVPAHSSLTSLLPVMTWGRLPGANRKAYSASASPPEGSSVPATAPSGLQLAGETMEEIRSRIFGTHIGNGLRSGRKVLRTKLLGPKIASYYPEDILKSDPFLLDHKAERSVLVVLGFRRAPSPPPARQLGRPLLALYLQLAARIHTLTYSLFINAAVQGQVED